MFPELSATVRTETGVARPDVAALAALAATMACIFVGGVGNDDLLKVYAATLRIVDGQLPYRDFFPQNAPLANVLAAPVFAVLPTIGTAALALAVALNVAATLLMHRLIMRLTGNRVPAFVAGVLMAVWYCQIGGYYFDQVTYLLGLAAFARYAARPGGAGGGAGAGITEGLLLACGGLAKQTVGTFVAAAFVVTVLLCDGWKPLLRPRFIAAFAGPLLAFSAYLTAIDGWQQFYTYAIVQPAEYAGRGYESRGRVWCARQELSGGVRASSSARDARRGIRGWVSGRGLPPARAGSSIRFRESHPLKSTAPADRAGGQRGARHGPGTAAAAS